jgi:hypothetical protein
MEIHRQDILNISFMGDKSLFDPQISGQQKVHAVVQVQSIIPDNVYAGIGKGRDPSQIADRDAF